MLANVLPGLRELRPPLAAGALWLVIAFVAARAAGETDVDIGPLRRGVVSFEALASAVDETWGPGVMLGFAAFLIGGLSHAFLTDLLRVRSSAVGSKGRRSIQLVARQAVGALVDEIEVARLPKVRASTVDPVLVDAVGEAVTEARDADPTYEPGSGHSAGMPDVLLDPDDVDRLEPIDWRSVVRAALEKTVPGGIEEELPSVATRLIGQEQELFDQYDRLRAEAEFRMSLVPPVGALALTLAFVVSPWISVVVALSGLALFPAFRLFTMMALAPGGLLRRWNPHLNSDELWQRGLGRGFSQVLLAGIVAGAAALVGVMALFDQAASDVLRSAGVLAVFLGLAYAIFAQGSKIQREAGDLLADAIFVGRVQSPLLERLLRTVRAPSAADEPG